MSVLDLKIKLPNEKLELTRGKKIGEGFRERKTSEKYFRQAIQIYNKRGELVDSGFVQVNDYSNMCKMVKICNKSKKSFHLVERWEWYGSEFYKTNSFTILDLTTGNTIGTVINNYVSTFVKDMTSLGHSCFVGDLQKDEYSEILLELLNEYSKKNAPPLDPDIESIFKRLNPQCECNLFEKLEIEELFRNSKISEEEEKELLDGLICECENNLLQPPLTEEQKEKRFQLTLKAQSEIYMVFEKDNSV